MKLKKGAKSIPFQSKFGLQKKKNFIYENFNSVDKKTCIDLIVIKFDKFNFRFFTNNLNIQPIRARKNFSKKLISDNEQNFFFTKCISLETKLEIINKHSKTREGRGFLSDLEIVNSKTVPEDNVEKDYSNIVDFLFNIENIKPKIFCSSFLMGFRCNQFRYNEQDNFRPTCSLYRGSTEEKIISSS
ncbi:hypothetical protein BpHYR1_026043 [Brachionus plicatilis]|uniref:Uncharacterized protein n=1 Tax=Brachionus plicatilis TaxID=10195 RepID=A0A3M7T023_BRAPC|nr:hypothetical protein BpHYR1_026043 [Brachionus plicatilis]